MQGKFKRLHEDAALLPHNGVTYIVKFAGAIPVNVSMRTTDFETRTNIARECIYKVCEERKLRTGLKHKKNTKVEKYVGDCCIPSLAMSDVKVIISSQSITLVKEADPTVVACHNLVHVSFASGGVKDIQEFVAYVGKDEVHDRLAYVLQCHSERLAADLINTIGQAFHLRYEEASLHKQALRTQTSVPPPLPSALSQVWPMASSRAVVPVDKLLDVDLPLPDTEGDDIYAIHPNVAFGRLRNQSGQRDPSASPAPPLLPHRDPQLPLPPVPPSVPIATVNAVSAPAFSPSSSLKSDTSGSVGGEDVAINVESQVWYVGPMSREDAQRLLTVDGEFLVRAHQSMPRQYVLSGRHQGNFKHLFLVDPDGKVRTKDQVFQGICHLIQFHIDNKLPIRSSDCEIRLLYPVNRR